jgi:hypothetical protein
MSSRFVSEKASDSIRRRVEFASKTIFRILEGANPPECIIETVCGMVISVITVDNIKVGEIDSSV